MLKVVERREYHTSCSPLLVAWFMYVCVLIRVKSAHFCNTNTYPNIIQCLLQRSKKCENYCKQVLFTKHLYTLSFFCTFQYIYNLHFYCVPFPPLFNVTRYSVRVSKRTDGKSSFCSNGIRRGKLQNIEHESEKRVKIKAKVSIFFKITTF